MEATPMHTAGESYLWKGDYVQDGKPNEMHFDSFSVLENVVKGIGKDAVGYFGPAGVRDDTYISFRKIYLLHKDKYYV